MNSCFLSNNFLTEIPIVDDFPTAISRVIYKCLRIEDVSRALRDIHSWFENQSTDDDLIEQPKFTNELWHAQYNLMLHYVKKEKDVKDCIIRKVFDLITPLKVTIYMHVAITDHFNLTIALDYCIELPGHLITGAANSGICYGPIDARID